MLYFTYGVFCHLANEIRGNIRVMLEFIISYATHLTYKMEHTVLWTMFIFIFLYFRSYFKIFITQAVFLLYLPFPLTTCSHSDMASIT